MSVYLYLIEFPQDKFLEAEFKFPDIYRHFLKWLYPFKLPGWPYLCQHLILMKRREKKKAISTLVFSIREKERGDISLLSY